MAVGLNVKPFESQPALIDLAPTLVSALDAPTAVQLKGRRILAAAVFVSVLAVGIVVFRRSRATRITAV